MNIKTNFSIIDENNLLERTVPYLLLNFSFYPNLGLLNGRMGGVIFFYHLAQYTQNSLYEEYAEGLIDEIYEDITENISINLEDGLSGIGWGIEYLVQNQFIEGNTDEILFDIDKKIIEIIPFKIDNSSIESGLGGILLYILTRLSSFERKNSCIIDPEYLQSLYKAVNQINLSNDSIPLTWIKDLNHFINTGKIIYGNYKKIPDLFLENCQLPLFVSFLSATPF